MAKKKPSFNLDPDQIFLDSRNLPEFSRGQLEGVIEKPITRSTFIVLGACIVVLGILFSSRAFFLQAVRGEAFALRSEENSLAHQSIPAPRGIIYDRVGEELAWNVEGKRAYTVRNGFGHLIGFTGLPNEKEVKEFLPDQLIGKEGIEARLQSTLAGVNGKKVIEETVSGEVAGESVLVPPLPGKPVSLSIDARVNEALYDSIRAVAEDRGFQGGAGVVMNVKTGELLAMVNYPEYKSEILSAGTDKEIIKGYQNDSRKPFLNRVVQGLYTPGSIIKPYIAIGALEEGTIDPLKNILSTGSISVQNPYDPTIKSVFRDWKAHGWVDMRKAIAVSSNVYFFAVGGGYEGQVGLGIDRINTYTRLFGFGTSTNSGIPGEAKGLVPSPEWKEETFDGEPWRLGDTYNTTIGQYGFQVTALQVVRAVGAIANNGYLVTPGLLKIDATTATPRGIELPVSKEHLQIVREGMRLGTQIGTGQALNLPYVAIGVKTGTAELNVDKSGVNSWVTGFFPYENPEYSFAIVLEKGKTGNTVGASYAAQTFFTKLNQDVPLYLRPTP